MNCTKYRYICRDGKNLIKQKLCTICNKYKDESNFYFRRAQCKECFIKTKKEYYEQRSKLGLPKYKKRKRSSQIKIQNRKIERKNLDDGYRLRLNSYQRAYNKYGKNIKWCPICKQYKSKQDFFVHKYNKDGLTTYCKECLIYSTEINIEE